MFIYKTPIYITLSLLFITLITSGCGPAAITAALVSGGSSSGGGGSFTETSSEDKYSNSILDIQPSTGILANGDDICTITIQIIDLKHNPINNLDVPVVFTKCFPDHST